MIKENAFYFISTLFLGFEYKILYICMVLICTLKLYPRDQTESTSFGSDHLSEIQEPR